MKIPIESLSLISESLVKSGFCGNVTKEDPDYLAAHYLDIKRLDEQISLIEYYQKIEGMFLEIGSGFGGLVTYLNTGMSDRCRAYGIEPAADAYSGTIAVTRILAKENKLSSRFVSACGEAIPLKSNSFDIVYSTSVLEHVKDPEKVISEALRVLKPGGLFQFVIPNYSSWWEGHYGVLMLPGMSKNLFKLYVKCLGRDPEFVDTLQFTNKKMLKRILAPFSGEIEILSWGTRLFEHRLKNIDFSEWASLGKLKKWIVMLHKFGLVNIGIKLSKRLNWETPFVLTIRKKN